MKQTELRVFRHKNHEGEWDGLHIVELDSRGNIISCQSTPIEHSQPGGLRCILYRYLEATFKPILDFNTGKELDLDLDDVYWNYKFPSVRPTKIHADMQEDLEDRLDQVEMEHKYPLGTF